MDNQKEEKNTILEKLVYKELRQRYQQIAATKEIIWRHRAKRQWLKEGNNKFVFGCTVVIIIPEITTILLFMCHLNISVLFFVRSKYTPHFT
jgi:hypothetical protein